MDRLHAFTVTALVLLAAGGALAATGPAGNGSADGVKVELSQATQALKLSDSRAGHALVRGKNLAPGARVRGKVTLRVSAPGQISLSARTVRRLVGPRGGVLAKALVIRVTGIGGGTGRWDLFYEGPVRRLKNLVFPRWLPGERHRFRVVVRFPASPLSQDELQGARAKFRLIWRALA